MVKNKVHTHLKDSEQGLLEEVGRYFDCMLTDDEEKALKEKLACAKSGHPLLDEARAVMGFNTIRSARSVPHIAPALKSRRPVWRRVAGVAVAIALIGGVAIGLKGVVTASGSDEKCFAYVNGKRVVEEEEVFKIICDDMKELNDCLDLNGSDITDDMEVLAPAAISFCSQFDPLL